MRLTAPLTSKGQVTIPKSVREFLQVEAGHRLNFVIDRDNNCVQMYSDSDTQRCLACEGKGEFPVSRSSCIVCLGTGQVPSDIQPLQRIQQWREFTEINIESLMRSKETDNTALYIPQVKIFSPSYNENELIRMNDSILIYLFQQLVVQEKNYMTNEEYKFLEDNLQGTIKNKLSGIFRIKEELADGV